MELLLHTQSYLLSKGILCAVISGVGVRNYYAQKHDYKLYKNYMVKHLVHKRYKYGFNTFGSSVL